MRRVLILGSAKCLWSDYIEAVKLAKFDAVCAVNQSGCHFPDRIDYWCTLHPEKLLKWQQYRHDEGYSNDYVSISHEKPETFELGKAYPRIDKRVDFRYPGMTESGSSGLLAVKAMQEEGFDQIVIAGMPMQLDQAHFHDAKPWSERNMFIPAWEKAYPFIHPSVRSMSGWTCELLGYPSHEWFVSGDHNSGAENVI